MLTDRVWTTGTYSWVSLGRRYDVGWPWPWPACHTVPLAMQRPWPTQVRRPDRLARVWRAPCHWLGNSFNSNRHCRGRYGGGNQAVMTQEAQEMLGAGYCVGNNHMGAVVFPSSACTEPQQCLHAGTSRASGPGHQIAGLHARSGRFPRTTHYGERLVH